MKTSHGIKKSIKGRRIKMTIIKRNQRTFMQIVKHIHLYTYIVLSYFSLSFRSILIKNLDTFISLDDVSLHVQQNYFSGFFTHFGLYLIC